MSYLTFKCHYCSSFSSFGGKSVFHHYVLFIATVASLIIGGINGHNFESRYP